MPSSPRQIPPWRSDHAGPSTATASDPNFHHAQPEAVLNALREQIASGQLETDVMLDAITVAAQFVTDSNGAALAMRRDGVVVCVGRSGEIAPETGSRVSESSGISGECLRSGETLRCHDTEIDPRVEVEVCRALGIRSIAAVPVRSSRDTVGVLEVFSVSPQFFTDEHLAFLSSLAGLVETVTSSEETFEFAPPVPSISEPQDVDAPQPSRLSSAVGTVLQLWQTPRWRYVAIGAFAAILLLSIVGWRTLRSPAPQAVTTPIPNPTEHTETIDVVGGTADPVARADGERAPNPQKPPLVQASSRELDDVPIVRRFDTTQAASTASITVERTPLEKPQASAPEPPQIAGLNHSADVLKNIVPNAAPLPSLGRPVSQGVTPPVLQRKVMPRYPAQALAVRIEGAVVLQAWVNESGRVDQVSVVSGPTALGQAAMDAVKEWRYRPAMLNGKPVRTETRITINFQASNAR